MHDLLALNVYPNPFSDRIHIDVTNADENELVVAIYELTGQLIKILDNINGEQYMNSSWDGTDSGGHRVPSGISALSVYLHIAVEQGWRAVKELG
jgi:flagellar hook assembly protein FlgD